jgi:hypothetical protein
LEQPCWFWVSYESSCTGWQPQPCVGRCVTHGSWHHTCLSKLNQFHTCNLDAVCHVQCCLSKTPQPTHQRVQGLPVLETLVGYTRLPLCCCRHHARCLPAVCGGTCVGWVLLGRIGGRASLRVGFSSCHCCDSDILHGCSWKEGEPWQQPLTSMPRC